MLGIKDLKKEYEVCICNGMLVYVVLVKLKVGDKFFEVCVEFDKFKKDLGYGLLLKKYINNVVDVMFE